MNVGKRIISIVIAIAVFAAVLSFNASAASAAVAFSNSSPVVGSSVSVTLRFNGNEAIYGVTAQVSYDSSILEFVSGDNANGSGGKIAIAAGANSISFSTVLKFTAKAVGNCTVSITSSELAGQDETNLVGTPTAAATLSVKSPVVLSANANLSSLTVSQGTLSPAFSANVTSYAVNVPNDVTTSVISATAADSGAKIAISSNNALAVGVNNRTVSVTAPNGATKKYSIKITRATNPNAPIEDVPGDGLLSQPMENEMPKVTIDGVEYTIPDNISEVAIPTGMILDEYSYNNSQVPIFKSNDGKMILMYLLDSEENGIMFSFNVKDLSFRRVTVFTLGDKVYQIVSNYDPTDLPQGFTACEISIADNKVLAYSNDQEEFKDYYLIYAMNSAGTLGLYTYDAIEGTLQRYVNISAGVLGTENQPVDQSNAAGITLLEIMFIVSIALAVLTISLIVILIVVIRKKADNNNTINIDPMDTIPYEEVDTQELMNHKLNYEQQDEDSDLIKK